MKKFTTFIAAIALHLFAFSQPGVLDISFGNNGVVQIYPHPLYSMADTYPTAIEELPDGKILTSGRWGLTNANPFLFKFNSNGSVDNTFGNLGFATSDWTMYESAAQGHVVQADGKIVVGGTKMYTAVYNNEFFLTRFLENGTIDSSFGINGEFVTSISTDDEQANYITSQNDGKIIFVGKSVPIPFGYGTAVVTKFNSNCTLDNTFDSDGYKMISIPNHTITGVTAISTDERDLIIGGNIAQMPANDLLIYKMDEAGNPVLSFGTNGYKTIDLGSGYDEMIDMEQLMDGSILVLGSKRISNSPYTVHPYVVKLTSDGNIDPTFGTGGFFHLNIAPGNIVAQSSVLDQNEHLIITGYFTYEPFPYANRDVLVASVNSNGTFDTTFNNTGYIIQNIPDGGETGLAVNIQADNKIIIGGSSYTFSQDQEMLLRYENTPWTLVEEQSVISLSIFPNPAIDEIRTSETFDAIIIYHLNGGVVLTSTTQGNSINISTIPAGMYILELKKDNQRMFKKFIKTTF